MSSSTVSATRHYFERFKSSPIPPRTSVLGSTGLTVSKVGFGCYRVHEFEPDHRQALREALLAGINLIDTSTNYTDGSSERMVGEVTSELFETGALKREEIVFVTKAGYLQGTALRDAKARPKPYSDMVEFQADCWHNISPEFLSEQITKSLERLKLETIDIVLLHNPEYFLKTSSQRDQYYQRIEKAFRHLETEVEKGRIKFYGVSSNTFPDVESKSDFTSLSRIHAIAESISKNHKFAVVQFPFNLYESGAALHVNSTYEVKSKDGKPSEERVNVFEFAKHAKLGVLTNRPFNSYSHGRLFRFTSFPSHDEVEVKGGLHTVLGRAIELEKRAPGYPKSPDGLRWAHALRERLSDLDDVLQWRDVLYQQIFPSIRTALSRLGPEWQAWSADYQTAAQELLKLVTWDLENLANQKGALISEQLYGLAPDLKSSLSLSQKVLRIYQGFPHVSSVLIGMRNLNYVQDVLGTEAPLSEELAKSTLERLQRHRS
jgi:aryl-alcohol dehydrogenase-like predicted oxidoreductase